MKKAKAIIRDMLGSITFTPEEERKLNLEAELDERERLKRFYIRFFGKRFWNKDLDNYVVYSKQQERIYNACLNYVKDFREIRERGEILVLLGKPGTGKNHLVYGIIKKALDKKYTVELSGWLSLMEKVKDAWNGRLYSESGFTMTESELIRKYTRADFLVIEEIGVQFKSASEKIILFKILNQRYIDCKPCILISNLGLDDFKQVIDLDGYGRIWDRIIEVGTVYICDWESYRVRTKRLRNTGRENGKIF